MLVGLLALQLLSACGGAASSPSCSVSWWCTSAQCASVMGGSSGTAGPFASASECEAWRHTYILTSSCSCGGGSPTPPAATLTSITVTPSGQMIALGDTLQLTATGHYTDGTTQDLTNGATWYKDFIGVVGVSTSGLVSTIGTGTAVVSATSGSITGSATVYVIAKALRAISISPADPSVPIGSIQSFVATAVYSDGSTAPITTPAPGWSSSDPTVAALYLGGPVPVSGASFSALAVGTATITASWGGLVGRTTLTVTPPTLVSVAVSPQSAGTAVGYSTQFTATGTYSDGSTQDVTATATWSSAPSSVATSSGGGLFLGLSAGTTTITAAAGAVSGTASLTVSVATLQSVSVTPSSARLAPGQTLRFVAVGHFSNGLSIPLGSGVTWTSSAPSAATVDSAGTATAVAAGSTIVTAAHGGFQGGASLLVTLVGTHWVAQSSGVTVGLAAVTHTGTRFVAVGDGGTILTSPDGAAWTAQSSGTVNWLMAVTWSGSQLVAVGSSGTILTSPDGITWTVQTSGTTVALTGVAWSGTRFVAVGYTGTVLSSADAITWSAATPVTTLPLNGVAWGRGLFAAVGGNVAPRGGGTSGISITSLDGLTWTPGTRGLTLSFAVASSATTWVAVGGSTSVAVPGGTYPWSYAATSPDATVWTPWSPAASNWLRAVIYTGQEFLAAGDPGALLGSVDGETWAPRPSGTTASLKGLAWSGTSLVAVGSNGTILLSP